MSKCNEIDNVLRRNGTGQSERFISQLNPSNFKLIDFEIEDWILFAYNFAKHINYFETIDSKKKSSDWQDFFNCFDFTDKDIPERKTRKYKSQKKQIADFIEEVKEEGKLTPHLTLFVCFLQLLEQSQSRFNQLTRRHLDFYYKDILKLSKQPATPDRVHILFELAKKTIQERIPKNTQLNAKNDEKGTPRIFETNDELIASQASIEVFKSMYNSPEEKELKYSKFANTLDGIETPLTEDEPYWYPFGYTSRETKFIGLPDAKMGFALASPMFLLKEGKRTIELVFEFEENNTIKPTLLSLKNSNFTSSIKVYASGKEKWIGPFDLTVSGNNKVSKINTNDKFTLVINLTEVHDAVMPYNEEVILEGYKTSFPILRFEIDTTLGYDFYKLLSQRVLKRLTTSVEVSEATQILVENDNGVIKQSKPFFPFTNQPVERSNFYIDYPEAFQKKLTEFTLDFDWKNTPPNVEVEEGEDAEENNFKEWYKAYLKPKYSRKSPKDYIDKLKSTIENDDLIVTEDTYFKAEIALKKDNVWVTEQGTKGELGLFTKQIIDTNKPDYSFKMLLGGPEGIAIDNTSGVRLSLKTPFLHALYPRIYSLALAGDNSFSIISQPKLELQDSSTDLLIPNEPYTPLAENIKVSYKASESRDFETQIVESTTTTFSALNTDIAYNKERTKLFHTNPFGQKEEHNFLKAIKFKQGVKSIYDNSIVDSTLVQKKCKGGTLLIGLKNAEVQQTISFLIQVLEGTENPEVDSFSEKEKVQWEVLCDNYWKNISLDIIQNTTDNFLKSGIVKFSIPKEATNENTILPSGYIWVRVLMHRDYDAVCKVINIHTQAVEATFKDNGNTLNHLIEGLPEKTIKKMVTRIPQVKGLEQPYVSFGGKQEETDLQFYRRISERLRHKNRAITLWDYEHLILQNFPEVFKVKCLNHTRIENQKPDKFISAGSVTLVVIPDSVNKNVFDIFQPRVSKALLNKIQSFISAKTSMHIETLVINPEYEEVSISLEANFYPGFDESFYIKKLNSDIINFLSPWAFSNKNEIAFDVTLHKSVLIDYLEKLDYVDYLQNVFLFKEGKQMGSFVSPETPKSILVSAKSHNVSTVLTTCKGVKEQEPTICL